jgi:putrescine---pyruvate transaminase
LAVLDIMEREDILSHVRRWGPYFRDKMGELADLQLVGDVRGSHFMVCVECVSDRAAKTPCPGDWQVATRIFERCREAGLMVRPMGHLIVLSPPLTVTKANIDDIVARLRDGIVAVQDELVRERLWHPNESPAAA